MRTLGKNLCRLRHKVRQYKACSRRNRAGNERIEGIETAISYVKEVDLKKVTDSDVILIGSPNHMGKPAGSITGFIDKLDKTDLKTKWAGVFDTYMGKTSRMP